MEDPVFWLVAGLAAFCVGLGKGGVPVVTATAVPLMSLFMSPVIAAGLLLPVFIFADIFGLYAYRKNYHPKVLKIMLAAMPIGVFIGYMTSSSVPDAAITILIGLVGASFALTMILRQQALRAARGVKVRPGLFWGTITGFTSFVSHSGATPYQVYTLPLGLDKMTFAGTMIIAFAYINVIKLIPYYALGQLSLANLQVAALLLIPAVAGVLAGVQLIKVMPEKLFFRVIVWALLLLSLRLIWDGATDLIG